MCLTELRCNLVFEKKNDLCIMMVKATFVLNQLDCNHSLPLLHGE